MMMIGKEAADIAAAAKYRPVNIIAVRPRVNTTTSHQRAVVMTASVNTVATVAVGHSTRNASDSPLTRPSLVNSSDRVYSGTARH